MIRAKDDRDQVTIAKVYKAGQEHALRFWDELSGDERLSLLAQLRAIDFQLLSSLAAECAEAAAPKPAPCLEPAAAIRLPRTAAERSRFAAAHAKGDALLAEGKVACVMVAGGQGTRLGFPGVKGAFPTGPVSGKPLFRLHAEALRAVARRHGAKLPLYIMVSDATRDETEKLWRENERYGLDEEDVHLFEQGSMPAVDARGKLLLAAKGRLATAPNGHGGVVPALMASGSLADMRRRGVEMVYYFQVDNALARIADPVFLGFHAMEKAEMSTKVVAKRDPAEKVGVLGTVDGLPGVIEYSELSDEHRHARDVEGRLLFWAGNTAIHAFDLDFLDRVAEGTMGLPWHKAMKKVPCIDKRGNPVEPTEPNGIKFEMFVFDALLRARATMALECAREEEFAPLKNESGDDSPSTVKRAISRLHAGWLRAAGIDVPVDAEGFPRDPVEVSPLFALDGEGVRARAGELRERLRAGARGPLLIE